MIAKGERDLGRDQLEKRLREMADSSATTVGMGSPRRDSNANGVGSSTHTDEQRKSQGKQQPPKARRVVKKQVKKRRKKKGATAAKRGVATKRPAAIVPPPGLKIEVDEIGHLGPPEDFMEVAELAAHAKAKWKGAASKAKPSDTAQAKNSQRVRPSKDTSSKADDNPITELQQLVSRAKHGDDEAVDQIRRVLDENPAIWQSVGDLAAHAEMLLINVIADGNAMVVESLKREIDRLKSELTLDGQPTPLERLTVQRIVACWLHCQYTDRACLAADAAGAKSASWGKRQEWAERRYQMAIKSLDLVRRLKPRKPPKVVLKTSANQQQPDDAQTQAVADQNNGNDSGLTSRDDARTGLNQKVPAKPSNGTAINRIGGYAPSEKVPVA